MNKPRPKHLNLLQIRLPLPGIVSIMHRAFGAILFLTIPLGLYAMQFSLESAQSFDALKSVLVHPLAKLVILGLVWAYLHHFCAGIRYLALDLDYGTDLAPARTSAKAVVVVSLGLTLLIGIWLW